MMRKVLISLAVAASALAVATPASAQYFPQPQGYAYGYNSNWGQVRRLQVRIDQIQRQIAQLDRRDRIRDRSADRLRDDARRLEQRLRYASRNGLNWRERQDIEIRISRLEQGVRYAASNRGRWGNNAYNNYNGYGQNNGYYDRDRDGRDDRYEDDRGTRHD